MLFESVAAAFLAGLGTGAHCAVMCGPLACALRVKPVEYHVARILSYSLAGALCGGFGQSVLSGMDTSAARVAPFTLLAVFVALACGLDRRLSAPAFVSAWITRLRLNRNLGWVTPLLPCGPLWLMLAAAVASGSALTGGTLLFCFAMGTVFLYAVFQSGMLRLQSMGSVLMMRRIQSGLLWSAAFVLAWRLWKGGSHECCSL